MSIMKVDIRGGVMILSYSQVSRNTGFISLFNNIKKTGGELLRKLIV